MPTALGTVASAKINTSAGPIPMTGLVGWWDADDTSTFTFSSGNQVSQWSDKSGAGHHATWVNSGWPATRVPAGINGRAALDPHPAGLQTTLSSVLKPMSLIQAVKTGDVTSLTYMEGRGNGGPGSGAFSLDVNGGVVRLMVESVAAVGLASSPYQANTPTVLGVTYGSDDTWAHYRNGAAVGSGTTAGTFAPATLALGCVEPSAFPYNGLLGEVLVYNRVLSTVERQQVESYLKTKWGTP